MPCLFTLGLQKQSKANFCFWHCRSFQNNGPRHRLHLYSFVDSSCRFIWWPLLKAVFGFAKMQAQEKSRYKSSMSVGGVWKWDVHGISKWWWLQKLRSNLKGLLPSCHVLKWCRGISSLLVKDFESIGLNYIRNSFPPGTLFVVWFVVVRSHEVSYKLLLVNVWKIIEALQPFAPLWTWFLLFSCWKRGELSLLDTWHQWCSAMLSSCKIHAACCLVRWQARSTLKGEPIAFDEIGPPRIRWGAKNAGKGEAIGSYGYLFRIWSQTRYH